MKTPRISASSYSNTAPLIWSFLYGSLRGQFELILDNAPARSAELLAQRRVDCALVPVIEYQRIPDLLLVPDVCVGARQSVRSVCLVTKGMDLADVRSVALDNSSRTSAAMSKIVFREFYGFDPVWSSAEPDLEQMLAENDCALLIGDPALSISSAENNESGLRKFDLVEVWQRFTGFGFVFAMWMVTASAVEEVRSIDFKGVRDEGLNHLSEIVANYESEICLTAEDFRKYLSENISFSITEDLQHGMELFFSLAFRHKLITEMRVAEFLGQ